MSQVAAPDSASAEPPAEDIRVRGEPLAELPDDLFIPPEALRVVLDAFEGPLDLLLYLIRRQNLDVLDIPVAMITAQYLEYIRLMDVLRLELAGEYLVMAAWLAEIKSRLLLPKVVEEDGEEVDPRAELSRRLQAYAQVRIGAQELDLLPRVHRDIWPAQARYEAPEASLPPPPALKELLLALHDVLRRTELVKAHSISREPLSVRERMSRVLQYLGQHRSGSLLSLWSQDEGRAGLIVTFLAILELTRNGVVALVQPVAYGDVELRLAGPQE
nr:segregation/condensation protein A [Oceanococcus sp. HetDA_MAG_MS8]